MTRSWLLTVIMLLSATSVHAQVTQQWATYDGSGALANAIALATDGQGTVYVTGATSNGPTGQDLGTVAYDAMTGTQRWAARYNGPGNGSDVGVAIAVDGGSVYVTGPSEGSGSAFDYATVAYDATTGTQLWVARYNGPGNRLDLPASITVDGQGTVYVTGGSMGATGSFDYATVAYGAMTGTQLWVARYGTGGSTVANAVAVDDLGRVYVTGSSGGAGTGSDYATVAYDAMTGTQLWVARYDGPDHGNDYAFGLALDGLGSVYITGGSFTSVTDVEDYATVAYDATTGAQLWASRYRGGNGINEAKGIAVDRMGAVYVTGWSAGSSIGLQYGTVAYDSATGTQRWVAQYHGLARDVSHVARAITVDGLGGVYVTGESWSSPTSLDFATVAYDGMAGTQRWLARYDGPNGSGNSSHAIAVDGWGMVYVTGVSVGGASTVAYSQP